MGGTCYNPNRKISFVEEFNNYVLLSVSTRFIRDWITSRYLDQILQLVKSFKPEISALVSGTSPG